MASIPFTLGVFVSLASYRCLLCSMYIPFYFSCSFTIYHIYYVVSADIHMFSLLFLLFYFANFMSATFLSQVHSLAWDVRHTTQLKHHVYFTKIQLYGVHNKN